MREVLPSLSVTWFVTAATTQTSLLNITYLFLERQSTKWAGNKSNALNNL